jgi:hypothetical protein
MVAEPAPTPVTSPVPLTVATDPLLVVQVTVRPESGLPPASRGVAVSCTDCPTCTPAVAGLSVTDATGTPLTVIVAPPACPSLAAEIVATPADTPLTSPLPSTEATAEFVVPHVTVRPTSGLPLASLGVAASWSVCPTATLADAGLTVTDATGGTVTVIAAAPLCPSLVAVIVAMPGSTPLTSPLAFTVAAAGFS